MRRRVCQPVLAPVKCFFDITRRNRDRIALRGTLPGEIGSQPRRFDEHFLVAGVGAAAQLHLPPGYTEGFGEEGEQGLIGLALTKVKVSLPASKRHQGTLDKRLLQPGHR